MKHKLIIWIFLCAIFAMCLFTGWIMKQAFGANNQPAKIIVLCFDDGPRPDILKELLPTLEKYRAPATFFVQGWAVPQNKKLVKKMHDAGHEIENHSYGHDNLKKLFAEKGAAGVKRTVERGGNVIFEATCRKPKFFRPRSWDINEEIEQIIKSLGYTVMKLNDPDINTEDYSDVEKHRPPRILIDRVEKIISSRESQGKFTHVLVFHELTITAEALKILIPYFQNQGYQFLRLDEIYLS